MTRRSLVRFNDIKTDLREMLSGGFGRVTRDGAGGGRLWWISRGL